VCPPSVTTFRVSAIGATGLLRYRPRDRLPRDHRPRDRSSARRSSSRPVFCATIAPATDDVAQSGRQSHPKSRRAHDGPGSSGRHSSGQHPRQPARRREAEDGPLLAGAGSHRSVRTRARDATASVGTRAARRAPPRRIAAVHPPPSPLITLRLRLPGGKAPSSSRRATVLGHGGPSARALAIGRPCRRSARRPRHVGRRSWTNRPLVIARRPRRPEFLPIRAVHDRLTGIVWLPVHVDTQEHGVSHHPGRRAIQSCGFVQVRAVVRNQQRAR
jgi:hypothetical protein